MTTSSIVLTALIAVAVFVLVAAITLMARNQRDSHRHAEAGKIREAATHAALHVKQREARAAETAAKARAANAEADVKTAQAAGLQQQAAGHRNEAVTARQQLNEQWDRADTMDPASDTPETSTTAERKEHQDH